MHIAGKNTHCGTHSGSALGPACASQLRNRKRQHCVLLQVAISPKIVGSGTENTRAVFQGW